MEDIPPELLADLDGVSVPAFRRSPIESAVDTVARDLAGLVLETARNRYELAEVVRSCAVVNLDDGFDPAEIRAAVLGCVERACVDNPENFDDLAFTVRAALDDVLGPEGEGA